MFNKEEIAVYYYMLDNTDAPMAEFHEISTTISTLRTHNDGINKANEYIKSLPRYAKSLEKINKLRDEIVAVWSNNQSEIPRFGL